MAPFVMPKLNPIEVEEEPTPTDYERRRKMEAEMFGQFLKEDLEALDVPPNEAEEAKSQFIDSYTNPKYDDYDDEDPDDEDE